MTSGSLHVRHLWRSWEFSGIIDSLIQKVLSLESCVQIPNYFRRWIFRVEIFKIGSHVNRFPTTFKWKIRKQINGNGKTIFKFFGALSASQGKHRLCFSRKHGQCFSLFEKHMLCGSRGSKYMLFPFLGSTVVLLGETHVVLLAESTASKKTISFPSKPRENYTKTKKTKKYLKPKNVCRKIKKWNSKGGSSTTRGGS